MWINFILDKKMEYDMKNYKRSKEKSIRYY